MSNTEVPPATPGPFYQDGKKMPPPQDFDTSTLKGKAAVMFLFMQGCKKFGITPECIFRIADTMYKAEVEDSVLSLISSSLGYIDSTYE